MSVRLRREVVLRYRRLIHIRHRHNLKHEWSFDLQAMAMQFHELCSFTNSLRPRQAQIKLLDLLPVLLFKQAIKHRGPNTSKIDLGSAQLLL